MFHQPHEIQDALRLRAAMGADVMPLAGGTDIVVALNRQTTGPRHFLDLTQITGYSDVRQENGVWNCSAGATFARLGRLPVRALAEAAMSVGGPAIRNRATIGGNLGTASPAGDGCTALLAMDAQVELAHASRGTRLIPIDEYFLGYRKTALLADELITRILVPAGWSSAWYKIGKRSSINISIACCAVGVSPNNDIRIAFGCVAPTVIRAKKAEAIIEKGGLADAAIADAAAVVTSEVSPIDDQRASGSYRRAMCGVILRRLLTQLRDERPAQRKD
ncbi:MAG TPA: FAD binding domain-containing protein [Phycisphaerae bacterium]|nr:FAD binding domain-containing protein [Phycisphaerae bacterium]